ncbi:anti-sigma factor antagonist [Roseibium polysiphoniae]|uniref:Anti-sigma factor antagonist n=1 Tax=Roseibium polysiphoniae TaxID=2571221 RepID=A0A944CFS3_9HYPH|nr:STAS domain-containing protein [Roseibium polysiphoniae]MBS8262350.1 anti-sigma factor antagonist [Roseibium polysiphoniae]
MNLRTECNGTQYTAFISGQLQYQDNGAFRTLVDDMTEANVKNCVFELSDLTSIDSAGLGMLVIASDAGKQNGWSLTLSGAKGQVRKILELSRFDQLMTITD